VTERKKKMIMRKRKNKEKKMKKNRKEKKMNKIMIQRNLQKKKIKMKMKFLKQINYVSIKSTEKNFRLFLNKLKSKNKNYLKLIKD